MSMAELDLELPPTKVVDGPIEIEEPEEPAAPEGALAKGVRRIVGLEASKNALETAQAYVDTLSLEVEAGDPALITAWRELAGAEFDAEIARLSVAYDGKDDNALREVLQDIQLRAEDKLAESNRLRAEQRPLRADQVFEEYVATTLETREVEAVQFMRSALEAGSEIAKQEAAGALQVRTMKKDHEQLATLRARTDVQSWEIAQLNAEQSIPWDQRKGAQEALAAEEKVQNEAFITRMRELRVNKAVPVEAAGTGNRRTDYRDRPEGYPGPDASDSELKAWLQKQNLS